MKYLFSLALALSSLFIAACGTGVPECNPGEIIYDGRPPQRLFSYDATCRDDCFSRPVSSGCKAACDRVTSLSPGGAVIDDREIAVADFSSLGGNKALVYRCGYVDDAKGDAPTGWGILSSGPLNYLSGQTAGTARFHMHTAVYEYADDCTANPCLGGELCVPVDGFNQCLPECDPNSTTEPCGPARTCEAITATLGYCRFTAGSDQIGLRHVAREPYGEAVASDPGKLDVTVVEAERVAGKFFLAYETPTGQAESQVSGCFDLRIGALHQPAEAPPYRELHP